MSIHQINPCCSYHSVTVTRALPMKDDMESVAADDVKLEVKSVQKAPTACDSGDKTERERERHRVKMVNFRVRKKQRDKNLRREWRRLEREMKLLGEDLRRRGHFDLETKATTNDNKKEAIHLLTVLKEALVKQNAALQKNIQRHHLFGKAVINAAAILSEGNDDVQRRKDSKTGWRVYFPSGEPSFHYHPITRDQFQAAINSCYIGLLEQPLQVAGQCFNWNVQHTTVTNDQSYSTHARFTKSLECSLDAAVTTVGNDINRDVWPVIMNFGGRCRTQVLQQFDANSRVLVCNVFGAVNLRYICLMQRSQIENGGKQVVTFVATIFDSKENKRSRSAETDQDKLEWVTKGTSTLTLTELDHGCIDVVCHHWGCYQGSLHAQHMIVGWTQGIVQWEQRLMSTGPLPIYYV